MLMVKETRYLYLMTAVEEIEKRLPSREYQAPLSKKSQLFPKDILEQPVKVLNLPYLQLIGKKGRRLVTAMYGQAC